MKKLKLVPGCSPVQLEGKQGMARVYAEILDKQMNPDDFVPTANTNFLNKQNKVDDFKKGSQPVNFRPRTVDASHRFGKRGGST